MTFFCFLYRCRKGNTLFNSNGVQCLPSAFYYLLTLFWKNRDHLLLQSSSSASYVSMELLHLLPYSSSALSDVVNRVENIFFVFLILPPPPCLWLKVKDHSLNPSSLSTSFHLSLLKGWEHSSSFILSPLFCHFILSLGGGGGVRVWINPFKFFFTSLRNILIGLPFHTPLR